MKATTEPNDVGQDTTDTLDKDTIHELLSNSRRRAVLRILDEEGELDKGDLSSLVAADEYDKGVDELDSDERKRVHISLYQQHNDRLLDANVVRETNSDTIVKGPHFDRVYRHIELDQEIPPSDCLRDAIRNLF